MAMKMKECHDILESDYQKESKSSTELSIDVN